MKICPKTLIFLSLVAGIFCATIGVPANAADGDVVVESSANALIRQGILPVRIKCAENPQLAGQIRAVLNLHGAFSVTKPTASSAMISVSIDAAAGTLSAVAEGQAPAFDGNVRVAGTPDDFNAVNALCDAIIVAVGKKYGWNLKPIFSKTRLAFSSDRSGTKEIWCADLRFAGKITSLTNHRSISVAPHWSPDGSKILYTSYRTGPADVYAVSVATKKSAPFAAYKNSNTGGAFSPDGKTIALALSAKGPMNIYTKPAAGGNAKALCADKEVQSSPVFSPDGKTICFVSGAAGAPRLYTVPANGGKKSRLAGTPAAYSTDPDWSTVSPTKIAFSLRQGGDCIGVFDTASGQTTRLPIPRKLSTPKWCADGRHVVAVEESGKNFWLVLVDTANESSPKCTRISPVSMRNCSDPAVLILK